MTDVYKRQDELHLRGRGRLELVGEDLAGQGQLSGEIHDLVHQLPGRRAASSCVCLLYTSRCV